MRFRRLISWIITLAMILSLMPVSVFADDDARGKLTVEYYTQSYWGGSEKVGVEIVDFDDEGDSLSIEDIINDPDEYHVPKGYNITEKNFYFNSIRYNEKTNNIELDKFGKYDKKYFFIADNGSQIGRSDRLTATGTVRVYVEEQTANQSNFYYELDPDITLGYWREGTDSSIQEVTSQSLGVQNGSIDADLYGNNCSEGIVFFVKSSSDWVQSFTRELLPGSASDQGVYIALNDANLSSYSSRWFYDKAVEAKSQGYTYFFWYSKQGSGENNWKFKISATYCPIKVVYDVNGGNGYYPSINFNYTDSNKVFNIPSNTPQPPSAEYVFTGWKLVEDSDVNKIYTPDEEIDINSSYISIATSNPKNDDGYYYALEFVAQYEKKATYSITGTIKNGQVTNGNQTGIISGTSSKEMVFTSDNGYHITKVTVNGENITSVQPGVKTYTFQSISSVTSNNNVIVTTEEDEDVTVKYIAKSGGTVALQGTSDYSSNKSEKIKPSSGNPKGATAKANPGYKFKGWSTNPNATSGFITTQNIKPSKQNNVYSDATYYAFFEESDSVVITYRAAQPSMGQVPSNQNKENVAPVTGIPKGSIADAKSGYEFLYWTLGPTAGENGENIVSYSANFVPTKGANDVWTTRTYYAHFQEKTAVTIKYQSNDINMGTVSPTSENLSPVSGIAKGSLATANKGYEFVNWTLNGAVVSTEPQFVPAKPEGSLWTSSTYIANFKELDKVTITYEAEANGTVSPTNEVLNPQTGIAKGSTATANAGYEFAGWYVGEKKVSDVAELPKVVIDANAKTNGAYVATTFIAKFTEKAKVTITYEAESNGTVNLVSETINPETGEPNGSTATANAGYEFAGWYVGEKKVSDVAELTKEVIDTNAKTNGAYVATTFIAKFIEKEKVTITYEAESNGSVSSTSDVINPEIGTPNGSTATANAGYEFAGWYVGEKKVSEKAELTKEVIDTNAKSNGAYVATTFTAKFIEKEKVTITYEAEANGTVNLVSETINPEIGEPKGSTATANAGYEFAGWYVGEKKVSDVAELTKEVIDTNAKSNGAYVATTFTAKFIEKEKVTITYEAEANGTVNLVSETINPEIGEPKGSTATANAGYEFAGWYVGEKKVSDVAELTKEVIDTNAKSNGAYVATTFTAKFTEKAKVTITYEAEANGSVSSTIDVINPEIGEPIGSTATANAGYEFAGWYVGEKKVSDVAELTKEVIDTNAKTNGAYVATTFIAKFIEKEKVTITYEAEANGSVSSTSDVINPEIGMPKGSTATANAGYEFAGWYVGEKKVSDVAELTKEVIDTNAKSNGAYVATTFTAKFIEKQKVTITYEAEENGTVNLVSETINPEIGEPIGSTATANAGYEFAGWYVGENKVSEVAELTKEVIDTNAKSNGVYVTTTFIAKFNELDPITINYKSEDTTMGKVSLVEELLLPATGVAKGSTAIANTGYTFIGWYNSEDVKVSSNFTFTPSKVNNLNVSEIYTAKFKINVHKLIDEHVYRDLNGNKVDSLSSLNEKDYDFNSPFSIDANEDTREYDLSEIEIYLNNTKLDKTSIEEAGIVITESGNVSGNIPDAQIWIKYLYNEVPKYTVTYTSEGSPTNMPLEITERIAGDEIIISTTEPKRTGYRFDGWYPVDTTVIVTDGKFIMPDGDVELRAKWTPTDEVYSYEVQYYKDGKMFAEDSATVLKIDSSVTSVIDRTPIGYKLQGYVFNNGEMSKTLNVEITDDNQIIKVYYEKFDLIVKHVYGTQTVFDTNQSKATLDEDIIKVNAVYTGRYKKVTSISINDVSQEVATSVEINVLDNEKYEVVFSYKRNSSDNGGTDGGGGSTGGGDTGEDVTIIEDSQVALEDSLEKIDHYAYVFGYEDGTVKPNNFITREEVASIFYRLLNDSAREEYFTKDQNFPDVSSSRWSNYAIATLLNGKIISGYPEDGLFKPSNPITRAEFASIVTRFDSLSYYGDDKFTDIKGHWSNKFVNAASEKGWIKGYPDGSFKPQNFITRAEAVTLINNVLNRKVDKDGIHKDSKFWTDNNESDWYYEAIMEATNSHDYERNDTTEAEKWTSIKENKTWKER